MKVFFLILVIILASPLRAEVGDTVNGWVQTYDGHDTDKFVKVAIVPDWNEAPMDKRDSFFALYPDVISVPTKKIDSMMAAPKPCNGKFYANRIYVWPREKIDSVPPPLPPQIRFDKHCKAQNICIIGDTVQVVKQLLCEIKMRDDRIDKLYEELALRNDCIEKFVDWINKEIPDMYEQGYLWTRYHKVLLQLNYERVTITKP